VPSRLRIIAPSFFLSFFLLSTAGSFSGYNRGNGLHFWLYYSPVNYISLFHRFSTGSLSKHSKWIWIVPFVSSISICFVYRIFISLHCQVCRRRDYIVLLKRYSKWICYRDILRWLNSSIFPLFFPAPKNAVGPIKSAWHITTTKATTIFPV